MYTNADLKICQYLLIHIKWISWTLILRILELFIYKVCILEGGLTLKRVRHKIRTYIQMHRTNKYSQHSSIIVASLAKWLSVCLWTKWLWVQITLLSLKLQVWLQLQAMSSLTFRQTIECGFSLKLVCDMRITCSFQVEFLDVRSLHKLLFFVQ